MKYEILCLTTQELTTSLNLMTSPIRSPITHEIFMSLFWEEKFFKWPQISCPPLPTPPPTPFSKRKSVTSILCSWMISDKIKSMWRYLIYVAFFREVETFHNVLKMSTHVKYQAVLSKLLYCELLTSCAVLYVLRWACWVPLFDHGTLVPGARSGTSELGGVRWDLQGWPVFPCLPFLPCTCATNSDQAHHLHRTFIQKYYPNLCDYCLSIGQ